ncbi:MAG TPA: FecR domain-containing protein [Gemmatimonadaceae bacterium]|nr:FecR domain-containing protein [Gemmatimonadaceae bacterium]
MHDDPDWTLLDRYLSGECAPEEAAAIEGWARSDPSRARLLASMRRVWTEAATPLPEVNADAAWRALRERVAAAERGSDPAPVHAAPIAPVRRATPPSLTMHRMRPTPWRAWRLAAGIAVVVAAGAAGAAGWWRHAGQRPGAAVEAARDYVTARGQRAEVTLIDGTRVWLSVDSRLTVPRGYGAVTRDVALVGEAFFVVQHDAQRPFRVHAGGGVSEDLGTEFDVRAYPGDTESVVIVATGRVALRAATAAAPGAAGARLGRGEMGRLGPDGDVRVTSGVDLDAFTAWRQGRLAFDERPLRDVARVLERWYDIEIAVDDTALASVPVTASFTDQSADEALSILTGALGVRYTRHGRHVRITAPGDAR